MTTLRADIITRTLQKTWRKIDLLNYFITSGNFIDVGDSFLRSEKISIFYRRDLRVLVALVFTCTNERHLDKLNDIVCDCSNARAIVSIFPLVGCFPPMTEPSERSFSISFAIADETETQKRAQFRRFSSLLLPTKCSHWPRSIQRNPRKPMQCLSQTFGLACHCG